MSDDPAEVLDTETGAERRAKQAALANFYAKVRESGHEKAPGFDVEAWALAELTARVTAHLKRQNLPPEALVVRNPKGGWHSKVPGEVALAIVRIWGKQDPIALLEAAFTGEPMVTITAIANDVIDAWRAEQRDPSFRYFDFTGDTAELLVMGSGSSFIPPPDDDELNDRDACTFDRPRSALEHRFSDGYALTAGYGLSCGWLCSEHKRAMKTGKYVTPMTKAEREFTDRLTLARKAAKAMWPRYRIKRVLRQDEQATPRRIRRTPFQDASDIARQGFLDATADGLPITPPRTLPTRTWNGSPWAWQIQRNAARAMRVSDQWVDRVRRVESGDVSDGFTWPPAAVRTLTRAGKRTAAIVRVLVQHVDDRAAVRPCVRRHRRGLIALGAPAGLWTSPSVPEPRPRHPISAWRSLEATWGVHRSTLARWSAEARERLQSELDRARGRGEADAECVARAVFWPERPVFRTSWAWPDPEAMQNEINGT